MTCEEVIKRNLGLSRCKLPGMLKGMITLPRGTTITPANFQDLTAWRTLLLNPYPTRAFYWPTFRSIEDLSEESIYDVSAISAMFVRNGKRTWRFGIRESLCLHTKLYTHNSEGDVDVILIDSENNFIGTTNSEGNIQGFSVDLLNAEKLRFSDGSVASASLMYLCLADSNELDRSGVMVQNNFLNQLYRPVDVEITKVSSTGNDTFVVDVKTMCDGIGIEGLLVEDFVVTDDAGVSIGALTSATPDANIAGRYSLVKADSFENGGTVSLRALASLTVKAYEVYEPLVIAGIA